MTRPPAPPLTPAEQDRVDAFEAAPVLAEAWREPHGIGLDGRCQECDGPAAPDRPDTAAEVDEVETVARVLWTAANNSPLPWPEGDDKSRTRWRADFRRMARAALEALAARRPATEAEQAVERCRRLAETLDSLADDRDVQRLSAPNAYRSAAFHLRRALDPS